MTPKDAARRLIEIYDQERRKLMAGKPLDEDLEERAALMLYILGSGPLRKAATQLLHDYFDQEVTDGNNDQASERLA